MASAKKSSKSSASSNSLRGANFVICVRNDGYAASLELRKLYAVLRDQSAEKRQLLRVVDESGEDYLYPADYFIAVKLPQRISRVIAAAS
jgi:hypothetical protein